MRDFGMLNENELANLTIRDFGDIRSEDFTTLSERGIRTIGGFTLDCLVKLYSVLMKDEPENWQPDLRDVTIRELATTHREEVDILLLESGKPWQSEEPECEFDLEGDGEMV